MTVTASNPLSDGRFAIVRQAALAVLAVAALVACVKPAHAQGFFGYATTFELSESVLLDEADATTRTHLERAQASIDNGQWEEAIDTLRQVLEQHGGRVIRAVARHDAAADASASGFRLRRYLSVLDYCHYKLTALPAEGLAIYRDQVDPLAERRFAAGKRARDRRALEAIVDDSFASSVADDALFTLGELALERGDFGSARGYWEQIVPLGERLVSGMRMFEEAPAWLAYPDTDIPLADIQSRLVLVSIMEGAAERAQVELAAFDRAYPGAEGRIAGRQGAYGSLLAALINESQQWSATAPSLDTPTFAGNMARNHGAPFDVEVAGKKWSLPLPGAPVRSSGSPYSSYAPRRVAEDSESLLSFHPVTAGGLLLVNSFDQIRAFDVATGEPAWGRDPIVYLDEDVDAERLRKNYSSVGVARFTMTVHGDRLYARMGNPVTTATLDQFSSAKPGYLVCLDLKAEGRLVWKIAPDDERWSFEGSPVCDGAAIYVAMRRSDVRPQAHVAAYDARTGKLLWRRMVCAAETPAQGQAETTHNLLTLGSETIYYSTNLGAVAALSTHDGRIRWLTLYPRARSGDLTQRATHFYRDLTPCVYDRGRLFVAPSDSAFVFALDAYTGAGRWATDKPADAVHVLGVGGDNLIASGERLWWIHADSGKVVHYWPEGGTPKGFGRGLLAGERIYWPTREEIRVFDARNGAELREPIRLAPREATSGNLLAAEGSLIVTSGETMTAFHRTGAHGEASRDLAWRMARRDPHGTRTPAVP